MKIGIIGAGSLGLLYAFYLTKLQNQITLYTNREEQAEDIRRNGLTLIKNDTSLNISINADSSSEYKEDLLIVTVKQYHLDKIASTLKKHSPKMILFLQNGMGHLDILSTLSKEHQLIIGVSEHGALKVNNHTVIHSGIGKTKIAFYQMGKKGINKLNTLTSINEGDFSFETVDSWREMLIEKLMVNAAINPLTALLRVRNGALIENFYYKEMLISLFNEIIQVLDVHNGEQMLQHVLHICEKTSENESSMYKDIQRGSKTEIDAILGFVVKRAKQKNMNIPLTLFLYNAIKGIEAK